MQNSAALEGLNAKTADLLEQAKDFHADAAEMEALMKARAMRMKIITWSVAVGGGGSVVLPLVMGFL